MTTMKYDAVVLGAGIVGITLALELQKSGRKVLILDKGEAGHGCSYGNAGWLTPCFSMPLPQPGMFLKSIGWLLKPESPLYIKPEPSWLLMKWMLHFLSSMNEKKMLESVAVLTEISKYSLNYYTNLAARSPSTLGFDQKGLLMVSATEKGIAAAEAEMNLMQHHGVPGKRLSKEETLALEPSLKPLISGGVYFPTEAHIEPLEAVKTLLKEFEAVGGVLLSRAEAYNFEFSQNKISKVITTKGNFTADLVVLALGTWSRQMGKTLGVSIPVLGGKGYSMITNSFDIKPTHPMMIVERKVAITPRANSVRLAGTLELVRGDDSITPRRVNAILKASDQYLHIQKQPEIQEVWRGLRPCTPDGVPMLGFSKKWNNLFYSLGHQMLGLQSAPGSAQLSMDIIEGGATLTDARPFRPERFE
jgi:D-amino-acid dehydrogenase